MSNPSEAYGDEAADRGRLIVIAGAVALLVVMLAKKQDEPAPAQTPEPAPVVEPAKPDKPEPPKRPCPGPGPCPRHNGTPMLGCPQCEEFERAK